MTAFSLTSLTISGSALQALRGITSNLAQSNGATFFATASPLRAQPVISSAAQTVIQKIQAQLQQNQAQQQALAQAGGVVNAAIKGATQVATQLSQLRSLVSQATQPGTSTDQLQSLAQQFNTAISSITSSIQSSSVGGVNLLNGSNVQSLQAPGLSGSVLQSLNLQSGVVNTLTANSLQNALKGGGGNSFGTLITQIENAVSTNVGEASSSVIASFTNQFIAAAGGTSNPSQVQALGSQLINALGGQTAFDHQTQRTVGQILDSITFNAPQSVTTGLINQLVTSLQPASSSSTNLTGSDFVGANLQGANFAGANLAGVDFTGANLQGANFAGANLTGANFEGANLQGANLQNATIQGAYFKGSNLQGTIYENSPPPQTQEPYIPEPPPPFGQNFQHQNLDGANLSGQNLQSADFVRSQVEGSNFASANLTGASFERANAQGANFSGANLVQVDFAGANLQGANFSAPPPNGGGGGTGGGGSGGGSGGSNFDAVLSTVNQAITTVSNGLNVLNQEAQAIKAQNQASSGLTTTLNKEVGSLVNTNLTTETAKISSLQLAVNLGLQTIGITGQRASGVLQTLLTGQPSTLPKQSSDVSQTQTQIPDLGATTRAVTSAVNGTSANGSNSNGSYGANTRHPFVSSIPPSTLSSALNIQV
jgi:uncharacterized protein YjbI with pentapeptide repeats